jgi:hypothetical protein
MRRRLVFYFDRRNCTSPEDLADEVLDRIVRKLEEKGDIIGLSPARYCYVVAKFVFLENMRAPENRSIDINNNSLSPLARSRSPAHCGADPFCTN